MFLVRNAREFALDLLLGLTLAAVVATTMPSSKRKKFQRLISNEKRSRISIGNAPPSEPSPSQVHHSQGTTAYEGEDSDLDYEDRRGVGFVDEEEASKKLAARPPTPAPSEKSPQREPTINVDSQSIDHWEQRILEHKEDDDEEESESPALKTVNQPTNKPSGASPSADAGAAPATVNVSPQTVAAPAPPPAQVTAPVVPAALPVLAAAPTPPNAFATTASVAAHTTPMVAPPPLVPPPARAQMAAPALTFLNNADTQPGIPTITTEATAGIVQQSTSFTDPFLAALNATSKYEVVADKYAREIDIEQSKLHGIKERVEFINRVKELVQKKNLLRKLMFVRTGDGRVFDLFKDSNKIDLDSLSQAAYDKEIIECGQNQQGNVDSGLSTSNLLATILQKAIPTEIHQLVQHQFSHLDTSVASIALQDGQCYFIALCRTFFPITTELSQHFRDTFKEAKVTDFSNLKDYATHQIQCLNHLSSEFNETEGRTILTQLQETYPNPKFAKVVEDYRDNQMKAENPTVCPSARHILKWATDQEDIYVQGKRMTAYNKQNSDSSATEVQALLAKSQQQPNHSSSNGHKYTLQEALAMGEYKFFKMHGYDNIRRATMTQPSIQIGGVTAHWCKHCGRYAITHTTDTHKHRKSRFGSRGNNNNSSRNSKKQTNSNNNSNSDLTFSKTKQSKFRKEIKTFLASAGVDDFSELPPILRSIVDPSSQRNNNNSSSGAGRN